MPSPKSFVVISVRPTPRQLHLFNRVQGKEPYPPCTCPVRGRAANVYRGRGYRTRSAKALRPYSVCLGRVRKERAALVCRRIGTVPAVQYSSASGGVLSYRRTARGTVVRQPRKKSCAASRI